MYVYIVFEIGKVIIITPFINYSDLLSDSRNNVIACAKHFVGDGGTYKGINEGNTVMSYEDLERVHMAPYLDCISQGVSTIMASYSSWNGNQLHAHRFLLTEILKDKLGFQVKTIYSVQLVIF